MLHSTFWNHGAGGLELPAWAMSMLPNMQGRSVKSRDISHSHRKTERRIQTEYMRGSSAVFEGVFLDFLYPPQALAWLQKASVQQWQRWERRNARRLPEGFIVAARAYSSGTVTRNPASRTVGMEQDNITNGLSQEQNAQSQDANRIYAGPESRDNDGNAEGSEIQLSSDSISPLRDGDNERSTDVAYDPDWADMDAPVQSFGDSPSELAESPARSSTSDVHLADTINSGDALQKLRRILSYGRSGQSKRSREYAKNAVHLYGQLGEGERKDARLQREMLEWLSTQEGEMAKTQSIKLYGAIPIKERTLQTYEAVLPVLLSRKHFHLISKLHAEALDRLENGHQISRILFKYALQHMDWQLAISVERYHHEKYAMASPAAIQASQIRLFWLHVSEIPQLIRKAISLSKHLTTQKQMHSWDDHTRRFAATFFKEALMQEFLRADGPAFFATGPQSLMARRHIRMLITHISSIEEEPSTFFHQLLSEMLRPDSRYRYSQLHEIISHLYAKYRKHASARPPENLLMMWLERLTEYRDKLQTLKEGPISMSLVGLVQEWERHYGRLNAAAAKRLVMFFARSGKVKAYEKWFEYFRNVQPEYEQIKGILYTKVWVHTKRSDLDQAQQAFAEVKRITTEHGDEPDQLCWNALLQAHSRTDDLSGAFTNLQNMMDASNVKPNQHSFHHVAQILAKRGDVSGVEDLLRQYDDLVKQRRETAHLGSILISLVNSDNVNQAETTLREAIPRVKSGKIHGSLLGCFNILMTGYAMQRDIDSTMRVYRWMKLEGVQLDANSYAAVMQVLVFFRRTQEAYGILQRVMPSKHIEPTAFHYAILIAGFVNNRQAQQAVEVYGRMTRTNIKSSAAARAAYLKAIAITERHRISRRKLPASEPVPLEETMKELKNILRISDGAEIANTQPKLGAGKGTLTSGQMIPAIYFDFLIFVHGQRQCFAAMKRLYQQYKEAVRSRGGNADVTPIQLLSSLASSFWRAGEYGKVEECWRLAKEQADDIAAIVTVPKFRLSGSAREASRDVSAEDDSTGQESDESSLNAQMEPSEGYPQQGLGISINEHDSKSPPPAPNRRHILTRVLRYYVLSLHAQRRSMDAIRTITDMINQGYTLDNKTWNTFIESLCRTTPPLALLAFVLTERFLTPRFPGWSAEIAYSPRREAVAEGLQYMKARYLAPGQLMPQYRTVVWLAGALKRLRHSLALTGGKLPFTSDPTLKKYIGTTDLIRRHAPKTLSVVQTLPEVPDTMQSMVLRADIS